MQFQPSPFCFAPKKKKYEIIIIEGLCPELNHVFLKQNEKHYDSHTKNHFENRIIGNQSLKDDEFITHNLMLLHQMIVNQSPFI